METAVVRQLQIKHREAAGGSGLVKGGTQYVYSAAVLGLVCQCSCKQILGVWDSTGRFAISSTSESYTITGSTPTYTPLNANIYAQDAGVTKAGCVFGCSQRLRSPGLVVLSGTQNVPLVPVAGTPASGQYNINPTTGVYTFSASDDGTTVQYSDSYYRYYIISNQTTTIPSTSPYKITGDRPSRTSRKMMTLCWFPLGGGADRCWRNTDAERERTTRMAANYIFAAADANKDNHD